MLDLLGERQKSLLKLLLKYKQGQTVDELAQALGISRNAVRQHLAALEKEDLVSTGVTRPSGGRPGQLYILSEKGRELFPRHYAWMAQLVLQSLMQEAGTEAFKKRLDDLGREIGRQLLEQNPGTVSQRERVKILSGLMEQLGYSTGKTSEVGGAPVIEASNCVFHELAIKNPDVCRFDLALMSHFTGSDVDHQECMAKGGDACRFKFHKKAG